MALSEKSRAILEAIAKGHTYEQILVQDLAWTYHDIFQAAVQALETPHVTNEGRRSEEHTSELQSHSDLVCRLLLEKKNKKISRPTFATGRSQAHIRAS